MAEVILEEGVRDPRMPLLPNSAQDRKQVEQDMLYLYYNFVQILRPGVRGQTFLLG